MFRAFSRGLSITRVRVSTNPFHGNDDAIRTDDTSLQRRIVKHATFKERAENPDQESYLYRERRGTVLKSRKHWNVYKKWTEAEHDKVNWVLNCQKVKKLAKIAAPRGTGNSHAASVPRLYRHQEPKTFGHALHVRQDTPVKTCPVLCQ